MAYHSICTTDSTRIYRCLCFANQGKGSSTNGQSRNLVGSRSSGHPAAALLSVGIPLLVAVCSAWHFECQGIGCFVGTNENIRPAGQFLGKPYGRKCCSGTVVLVRAQHLR